MRPRAKVIILGRRRRRAFELDLNLKSPSQWPTELRSAWDILHLEVKLSNESALSLIMASVSSAHACAQNINRRVTNIVEFQTRLKLGDAFRRISRCIKRAPARLRRLLNKRLEPVMRQDVVDLEVIEEILDVTVTTFAEFPNAEASKTALRVMCGETPDRDRTITIKTDFSGLGPEHVHKAERAIAGLCRKRAELRSASRLFDALGFALDDKRIANTASTIHDLIDDYVIAASQLWKSAGLRPGRARDDLDPAYKSRFHRFAELVLSALIQPASRRNARASAQAGWLVTEHHIRRALRYNSKNGS
jgi:hypothetical protein